MCGIFGYVGHRPCVKMIYGGLSVLEYRGYDSAGIAVIGEDGHVACVKQEGKLSSLSPRLNALPEAATIGMGHTRWATHGPANTVNAHPHVLNGIALIHNGILENYKDLKDELVKKDAKFASDTDSEVILHLIEREYAKNGNEIKDAIFAVLPSLEGAFALAVFSEKDPDSVYLVKKGSPIAIGVGENENFFASDALSLLEHTRKAIFLNDGEVACLKMDNIDFWDFEGNKINRFATQLDWNETTVEKKGFKHYMLKEIHDQPGVVSSTIQRLIDLDNYKLNIDALGISSVDWTKVKNIHLVACGTAFYSCAIARYFLEELLDVPVNVELAHEFRYRDPKLDEGTLLIPVSQSGETADTLACVKYAKDNGAQTFALCNVQHSSIPRECSGQLYMQAGPEIGVASTKAFTSMILNLYLIGLGAAQIMHKESKRNMKQVIDELRALPLKVEQAIDSYDYIDDLAYTYSLSKSVLFLGRGMNYPLAFEGALKLKEISYIHAEGFAGGELKHGPIALVDRNMPLVVLAPKDSYYEKMLSNVEEVVARHGRVVGIGAPDDKRLKGLCADYIACPSTPDEALQTIISAIPLQIFAYCAAQHRGTDVDQPRNLAKSVTVE